ncbi:hypothetical protein ACHAXT_008185 [Thalassiosira profunda]
MSLRLPAAYQGGIPLSLISWNVALGRPSAVAPDFSKRALDAPQLIRDACLNGAPDVIALQECPSPRFGHAEFASAGYASMGSRPSHCGYCNLLVKEELGSAAPIELPKDLPAVAAAVALPNGTTVALSSSHMAPFKEGAYERLLQCQSLMGALSEEADNCILLGDMNMRAAEDTGVENASGGGWIDAWKGAGADPSLKFSWNSFANRYHEGGFKFKARFERCYLRGEALEVNRYGFVGDKPVEGRRGDYLSDHFGLAMGVDVASRAASSS